MSPEGGGQSHQRFFQGGGGRLHYNDSEEKLVL